MRSTSNTLTATTARRVGVGLATAALAVGVAAGPAAAVVIQTGYGKIVNNGLSVGTNVDPVTGIPAGKATFKWHLVNGVTSVQMTGNFSAINRSGVPVRLQLKYYTARSAAGPVFSSHHTTGFTPASSSLEVRSLNWRPPGAVGLQSAKLCVANDADRDGTYTSEKCIVTSL